MSEYATKEDLLQHEKEAAVRRDVIAKREQDLRHNQGELYQKVINKVDDKVDCINDKADNNNKELALLKQSHNTMSENIKDIKEDMKEGFHNIESKMEEFISTIKDGYVTKEEHKNNEKRISSIEKGIWWGIALVSTILIGALLKLILV